MIQRYAVKVPLWILIIAADADRMPPVVVAEMFLALCRDSIYDLGRDVSRKMKKDPILTFRAGGTLTSG